MQRSVKYRHSLDDYFKLDDKFKDDNSKVDYSRLEDNSKGDYSRLEDNSKGDYSKQEGPKWKPNEEGELAKNLFTRKYPF